METQNKNNVEPQHFDNDSGGYENLLKIGALIGFVVLFSIGLILYFSHSSKNQVEVETTDKQFVEKIEKENIFPSEEAEKDIIDKMKPSEKEKVNLIDVIQTDIAQNGLANIINNNIPVEEITRKPSPADLNKLAIEPTENNDCAESISEKISIIASCENEHTGYIEVSQIQGGKGPYIVQLNNGHFAVDHAKFPSLPSGDYTITISDENKCKKIIKDIIIPKKHCEELVNQHHIQVNADYLISLKDAKWHLPNCPDKAYLEIRLKDGEHIYAAEFKKNVNETWHLQNQHGHIINLGVYLYSIKNMDTNEFTTGTITVVE